MNFFLIFVFIFHSFGSSAQLVEQIQAQVGEEKISLQDLKTFQQKIKLNLIPSSLLSTILFDKKDLLYNKKDLLKFMVFRSLLNQIAKEQNLETVSEKQIENILKSLKQKKSKIDFSKKLVQARISLNSLKKEISIDIRNDLLIQQFIISKISFSEQDIESYYFQKYKKPLFKTFEYEFALASFPKSKKKELFKRLSKSSIKNLKKFTKTLKGDYKIVKLKQKDLQKDFKRELEKLSVSQISSLLPSGNSYYLFQLNWKTPILQEKEQHKKIKIEKAFYKKQIKRNLSQWIEKQKKRIFVL